MHVEMLCNTWQGVLTAHNYEHYAGTDGAGRPRWSRSPARAVTIADAPVGELSVIYDPGLKQRTVEPPRAVLEVMAGYVDQTGQPSILCGPSTAFRDRVYRALVAHARGQ